MKKKILSNFALVLLIVYLGVLLSGVHGIPEIVCSFIINIYCGAYFAYQYFKDRHISNLLLVFIFIYWALSDIFNRILPLFR